MTRCFALVLVLNAALTLPIDAIAQQDASRNLIQVEVLNLRSDNGLVGCLLFSVPDGFPGDESKAVKAARANISGRRAVCDFSAVAPGDYAVSVTHDENSNGRIDTNFLGMPREGVGASNDAKGSFGPPKFEDARFRFGGGREDLQVHIRYLRAPF